MPDFKVLRGSSIIPAGSFSLGLQDGVDYNLEPGIAADAWWVKITNTHHTGMGRTTGGSQNADDVTCHLRVSGDDFAIDREGSSNNCRVDWEIIQYIGAPGGPNEIKVRQKGEVSGTAGILQVAVPGSVGNVADVVPFITGQGTSDTGRNAYHSGLCTAVLNGANFDFQRGDVEDTCFVSYALVEFTGSNWTVQNEQFTNPPGTDGPVTIAGVADVAKTFIHCTYRYATGSTAGLDDASVRVHLSSPTQLFIHDTTSNQDALKNHSVWLIENPQMTVTRYFATMAGVGEEEVQNFPITAVADLDQTLTTITNDSTGGGTAFPRGYINHLLTSVSNVLLRQSDNGQTSDFALEIVELPEDTGGGAITGILAAQESGADTFNGAVSVQITGGLSVSETGEDSFTGSGETLVAGALSATEAGQDAAAIFGAVAVQGALSATETGQDTLTATGTVTSPGITGTLSAQETAQDTFTASGAVEVTGALSGQEIGPDGLSSSGQVSVSGQLGAQEVGSDTFAGSGSVADPGIVGTLAVQETGADQAAATGSVGISGTLGAQESGSDGFTAIGSTPVAGLLAAQETGNDILVAAGTVALTGALAAQEAGQDTFAATGGLGIGGSLAAQESGSDTFAASGTVSGVGTITGVMAVQESGGGVNNLYLGSIPIGTINLG